MNTLVLKTFIWQLRMKDLRFKMISYYMNTLVLGNHLYGKRKIKDSTLL